MNTILFPKLKPPPALASHVPRPRLLRRLDAGLQRVQGRIGNTWLQGFDALQTRREGHVTSIQVVVDQAGLRGILGQLWDLNVTLLSVSRAIETGDK